MKPYLFAFLLCCTIPSFAKETIQNKIVVDSIFVSKTNRTMTLFQHKKKIKTYIISIGQNPIGHKQVEGDNRTPEGLYYINGKNPYRNYYKNLSISYPNATDIAQAKKRNQKPGGQIKIHGYSDSKGATNETHIRYSYTWGCIGLSNHDMKEVYDYVKVGAKIMISK